YFQRYCDTLLRPSSPTRRSSDLGIVVLHPAEQLHAVVRARLEHPLDRFTADAEMGFDTPIDFAPRREHWHDGKPCRGTGFVDRVKIEGIAGGHDQLTVVTPNGK